MIRIIQGLKSYYSDKKNRIVHIVMGISLLIASVFDSISPYLRIGLFAGAVGFNLIRMRYQWTKIPHLIYEYGSFFFSNQSSFKKKILTKHLLSQERKRRYRSTFKWVDFKCRGRDSNPRPHGIPDIKSEHVLSTLWAVRSNQLSHPGMAYMTSDFI